MQIHFEYAGQRYLANLGEPQDISLEAGQVRCFYAPPVLAEPVRAGHFTGSVLAGAPVNFYNITLNPHGQGTHTESFGHLSPEQDSVGSALRQFHFPALLCSLAPESYSNGDLVITAAQISAMLAHPMPPALVLRTLPNDAGKTTRDYSGTNPPYLEAEALHLLAQAGVQHLLLDLPSVDREQDGGQLAAHKAFWNYPGDAVRTQCTITELIFVPDDLTDGLYLLNLQVPPIPLDAAPSRPVLYRCEER